MAKLLARAGIASRREIERMIEEGRVALNEKVIDTPATILTSLDGVTVDGVPVEAPTAARLFLYHKPSGLLVTERDPGGRPTIYDKLPKDLPRLVPVGRLDLNTEGLLLLTTDGELKRQLELPSTGVERAYRARAYGNVTQAQLEDLIHGVEIEGVRYGSINANLERRTGANVWIEMILTEGKNREVRRVLEYLGLKVSRLIRTRYGPFLLADLPVGGVGEVKGHDVAAFRKNPTRNPPPERLRRDEKFSQRPKAEPVKVGTAQPRPGGPRPAPGSPNLARKPSPVQAGKPATRITREAASAADRAAFVDNPNRGTRAGGRPAKTSTKTAGWQPALDHTPREPAPAPGGVRPKRFYDAKPPKARDGEGSGERPARVFNSELGRNVGAKPPRAPRDSASDAARPARPSSRPTPKGTGKPIGGSPNRGGPPRSRK
ncbi:pseudouridine synthase [Sphingomonas sp. Leaf357]|nr:pseudouridine synthase [Sphingomonas sp. Leaf357]KQS05320.1 pseudouridine synthase [Sphingomonas sp. Leaf357]